MPNAAEVKIDPIVVLSPDVSLSKTKSEPNKQLTFPETQRSNPNYPVAVPKRQVPGSHSKDPRVTTVEPRMKQQTCDTEKGLLECRIDNIVSIH